MTYPTPRDISEAPKDRPILVFVPAHGWTRAYWHEDLRSTAFSCFAWSDSRLLNRMRPPTHFLEMPADPV